MKRKFEKILNIPKFILLSIIKCYRKYLSPLKSTKCPYYPTCSTYCMQAIKRYGAFKGGIIALWRLLRCNPFSKGGYDPLKENIKIKYIFINK